VDRLSWGVLSLAACLWVVGAWLFSPRGSVLVAALLVTIVGVLLVEVER